MRRFADPGAWGVTLRLGVILPQTSPWADWSRDLRDLEEMGYDVAYVYDHLTHPTAPGRWLADGFATLSAAAAVTQRIGLGTLVASATLRSPVALARLAGTVQDVSGGRFVLGLGAGSPLCALADRGETLTPPQMFARLRDTVEGLAAVWAGRTEWAGNTTSFSGLETLPSAPGTSRPPLLLAAHGPRALRLAVAHADRWNTYGGPGSSRLAADDFWSTVGEQLETLDVACAEAGRDPASLPRSLLLGFGSVHPTASAAAYREAITRAEDRGFDEIQVYAPGYEPFGNAASRDVHEQVLGSR